MLPLVEAYFCTDAYLTTGNVYDGGEAFYKCTEEYLLDVLENQVSVEDKLHVHTCITLSSGEIIDFTFMKGLSLKQSKWSLVKDVIILGDSKTKFNLDYMPMLVGEDFFRKAISL